MDNKRKLKSIEIDLFSVLMAFWKRKYIIILAAFFGAAVFLARAVLLVTPMYSSSVTMYANNSKTTEESTSISSADISASARLVNTYKAIILSDPVLEQVIAENRIKMSSRVLADYISVEAVNDTEVFTVSVSSTTPELCATIANAIAKVAPEKIADIVDGCSVKVISYAKVPTTRSWPSYRHEVMVGGAVGLVLSLLTIFVIVSVDTRIKDEDDLQSWEYPVLGVIPSFSSDLKSGAYAYSAKGGTK